METFPWASRLGLRFAAITLFIVTSYVIVLQRGGNLSRSLPRLWGPQISPSWVNVGSSSDGIDQHVQTLLDRLKLEVPRSLDDSGHSNAAGAWSRTNCLYTHEHLSFPWTQGENHSPAFAKVVSAYEDYHARCSRAAGDLSALVKSGRKPPCPYVLWRSPGVGIGNQLLSLMSTLLYAILTARVLLTTPSIASQGLCEPFLESSWFLPPEHFAWQELNKTTHLWQGHKVDCDSDEIINAKFGQSPIDFVATSSCSSGLRVLFCEEEMLKLEQSEWISLGGDQYWLPSLYYQKRFQPVLDALFPDGQVAKAMMRRFVHPNNVVWELIKQAYEKDMAPARHRVGKG